MIIYNINEAPFIKEMCDITLKLWEKGWAERNGGNISYLLKEEEVAPYLDTQQVISEVALPMPFPELKNKIFMVSGSGKYFRNVIKNPADTLIILKISEDGKRYQQLWGLVNGGCPTSELASHLKCHATRLKHDPEHRVILHTHANATIAMTFAHDLDEKKFSKTLWQQITECLVVFPEGVGIVPWMVAGTIDLGLASAAKMEYCRIVIWAHHGIMGAGSNFDDAFGLVETVDKAADIYLRSAAVGIKQSITSAELRALADAFNVTPRDGIL
ncbi:rhamnulose-1-phosphate aldolase [Rahnella variigena]|jgi:rhamnulose-1-phosphate aldolase|uniref:rhamnulose-1-phosphate aldolase n=1 Tax=Rahnella variigena TaxID=574964 RepID=UPI00101C5DD2|nr:rhamnulose-1-phosphate aldolase [Rahnella variigena]RYJ15891.1 rhamnulose-1-phosphate aldolase [Rahnella variigena]